MIAASTRAVVAAMAEQPVGGSHLVAATFTGGGQTPRKMGDVVEAGVSLRAWVERKLSQHLGIVPSEARRTQSIKHFMLETGNIYVANEV